MYYYRRGYDGGIRDWMNSMPLIFDRETGVMLHLGDLFTVDENIYIKRLTGAIYKYCEMKGMRSCRVPPTAPRLRFRMNGSRIFSGSDSGNDLSKKETAIREIKIILICQ